MKKRAYTLAEVLIALGIVGVLSALLAGTLNKLSPDSNKIAYLQTYNALTEAVSSIAQNQLFYKSQYEIVQQQDASTDAVAILNILKRPFYDTENPKDPDSKYTAAAYSGTSKFGSLLRDALGGIDAPSGTAYTFYTPQYGVQWTVTNTGTVGNNIQINGNTVTGTLSNLSTIEVDINGNKGPNSFFTNNLAKTPDRFRFFVTPNGRVHIADQYGQYYYATKNTWTKKKVDATTINNNYTARTAADFPAETISAQPPFRAQVCTRPHVMSQQDPDGDLVLSPLF